MTAELRTEPIIHERQIDASPGTVFAFFTDPEKLTRWLAAEATVDPRPGGVCHQTHVGRDGDRYYMRGEFVEVSPPSRVVFTWGFENDNMDVRPGESTVELPMLNVFTLRDGEVRHFWGTELLHAPWEPGQEPRHVDFIWPIWNVLDATPEGRGTDWGPSLSY